MGADSFVGLRRWHRAARDSFYRAADCCFAARRSGSDDLTSTLPPGLALERRRLGSAGSDVEVRRYLRAGTGRRPGEAGAPFYLLPGLDVEISASEIRAQLAQKPGTGAPMG